MQTGDLYRFVQNPALFLAITKIVSVPNSVQLLSHPASCRVTPGSTNTLPDDIVNEQVGHTEIV